MHFRAYAQKHESIGQNIGAGGIRYVVPQPNYWEEHFPCPPPGFARGRGCRGTPWIPRGTRR